jgi:hypothetical protein
VIPIFTLNSSYSLIKHFNVKRLRENYKLWGPSARTCISLLDDKKVNVYRQSVESAADEFSTNVNQYVGLNAVLVLHRLFFVRPDKSRQDVIATFASPHVLGFVSRAYAKLDQAKRQSFYQVISGHSCILMVRRISRLYL